MGSFTESIRNAWLDDFTSITKYLALFNGDPQAAGVELSGGGYVRVAINAADWDDAAAAALANSAKKSFPKATADWNGGSDITYWGVMSAITGGVLQGSGALTVAKPVTNGDTAEFDPGEIDLAIA